MPYHIKKISILGSSVPTGGVEYYAGDNSWTNDYDSRKIYTSESEANDKKNTSITRTIGNKSYTYQPSWWKNSVVVSE
tara:strand:+ start:151 stop:384 length:234 start_codon:yes stop_codon:yes gene_type:complete